MKSKRFVAIAVLPGLCVWSLFFELCKVPWIVTYTLIGSRPTKKYWVWERPKDIIGERFYTFDSVGMLQQIGNAAITILICGVLMIILLRWKSPTKGKCPKCDYDLRGTVTPGCPECGWERKDKNNENESAKQSA